MTAKLFETQAEWGGKQDSQAPVFRSYAQELGLDLAKYDAAVADEQTRERIRKDVADGTALGVTGTPTFVLNGKKLVLNTEAEFRQMLAHAANLQPGDDRERERQDRDEGRAGGNPPGGRAREVHGPA